MNRLIYFLIFLLSGIPDSDKHLEVIQSLLQATQDFTKKIKSGMDNFHTLMVELGQRYSGDGS